LLSQWGVDYEPVNVHGNPAAQAELTALGIVRVPATVVDGRFVHGWNPGALAELMGVPFDDTPALSPRELAESLDNILYYAQHLLERLTPAQLELKHPERDRTLRDLGWHVFRLSAAFVDCMEQGHLEQKWLVEYAPPEARSGAAVAAYGERVRKRIAAWFERAPEDAFTRVTGTYYGDQRVHLLLERTTWHAGQHLRQIYDLLERDRSLPVPALAPELFEGLPLPDGLW
jgi:DinB superfamily/Glutaredoxin